MYRYDKHDQRLIEERVTEFSHQTRRFLDGALSEDQFRSLRLMNGLYVERFAPMLRVAIPYGELSASQLRKLAHVARTYDRGYGHFTTRQNIQFNWPELEKAPEILEQLAEVQMHAIQSSGNCIRNTTTDHLAGIVADEIEDPRPYCEIIRQWSTLHPEFSFLPRKFKIAVTGSARDRAASQVHDIGLHLVKNAAGETGFQVYVGGGQGRTPVIGVVICEFLPKADLLTYFEAILRVFNLLGRRDNIYKARLKILVRSLGIRRFRKMVNQEWQHIRETSLQLHQREIDLMVEHFRDPPFVNGLGTASQDLELTRSPLFQRWLRQNTVLHKQPGYRAVYLSLKAPEQAPGDITAEQLDAAADLAERYSFGEARTTHTQNLLLPHVLDADLFDLWKTAQGFGLDTANIGTVTDIICCPGLDFCSLANATAIPIALEINQRFAHLDSLYDIGEVQIKISGCMNACGHHHVAHIGVLGVDKKGEEWYQLTLGGSADENARLGQRLGPAFAKKDVTDAIQRIIETYVALRREGESFLAALDRLGLEPFKQGAYSLLRKSS
ncbi:MAG: nitrite/sulfite reductase [Gammaproteobacteria bacterium]|nr:nitrite/sulfite reductase [Gammaproteobacteria bacterium]